MREDLTKFQCPACGGAVRFDVTTQQIICDFCNSSYPENHFDHTLPQQDSQQIDWKIEGYIKNHEKMDTQYGFSCTSCGAEIIADKNLVASECMYCGNPVMVPNNVSGMLKPDFILPFKFDKKEAEKRLMQFYRKKILLPNLFKSKSQVSKITGIYVPFWLFSAKGSGDIKFNAQKVSKRRSGNYEYITTKYYSILRQGSLEFEKVPVDASKKMEDNFMDGLEPFDYSELKEFSPSFMAGFFADKFDVDVKQSASRAKSRIVNSTEDTMKSTVTGYSNITISQSNLTMADEDIHYVLLPVWMLNIKYHNFTYKFAINGQTGKVSGHLPIDQKKKRILFSALLIISYFATASFIYFNLLY